MLSKKVCFCDQAQSELFKIAVWGKTEAPSARVGHRVGWAWGETKAGQHAFNGALTDPQTDQPSSAGAGLKAHGSNGLTDVVAASQAAHHFRTKRPADCTTPFPATAGHRDR